MPAPARTLASLAHALGAAADADAALLAFAETVAELDRGAQPALFAYDGRRQLLVARRSVVDGRVVVAATEVSLEHLPAAPRQQLALGGRFTDLSDRSPEFARLLGLATPLDGSLALRGMRAEGQLVGVLALREPRRMFGARVVERAEPAAALFDLALARFAERDARAEAVETLETVTRRVHGEYVRKLSGLEGELAALRAAGASVAPAAPPLDRVLEERAVAQSAEQVRRAERRAELLEQQLAASGGQLAQAQLESQRRGEALRQTERTLYLLDRVLGLDAAATDPQQLADGLLALVGDDMLAQRCSLVLRAPDAGWLYLAAARGVAPHVLDGVRIRMGEGVAGRVAEAREPLLVRDVRDASAHPLLHDQYFTTGSFISFPLVYHDDLVGVVNLTNRSSASAYTEDDVERVRLLALVIALVATHARLPERLAADNPRLGWTPSGTPEPGSAPVVAA
ncbi:MAG TPA: GAF domain-containing protein [Gemmatirosa sp.]